MDKKIAWTQGARDYCESVADALDRGPTSIDMQNAEYLIRAMIGHMDATAPKPAAPSGNGGAHGNGQESAGGIE